MNCRSPLITVFFAAIYLWISCTLLMHRHDGEHGHAQCTTEDHDHTEDGDSCSICFFMQHVAAPVSESLRMPKPHTQEYIALINQDRCIQHGAIYILCQLNKDPPFLSV